MFSGGEIKHEHLDRLTARFSLKRRWDGVFLPEPIQKEQEKEDESLWSAAKKDISVDKAKDVAAEVATKVEKNRRQKKPAPPFRRCVRVFDPVDTELSASRGKESSSENKRRLESGTKLAQTHDGFRKLPDFKGIDRKLAGLKTQFGNFGDVLEHLEQEMMLAGASRPESFRITPVLLDGPPGVGKTAFAQSFAKLLGLPFIKLSAGGMQHGATLTGGSSYWSNTQPGEVFSMLARGEWATGVILIDEADKLCDRQDHQILPALLDLLEPESAKRFTDESMRMAFDASRLIVLLTSNLMRNMNDALLSRCRPFSIEMPGPEQRALIARGEHDKMNSGIKRASRIELDSDAVGKLAESDINIRELIQAVRSGFTQALASGSKMSRPECLGKKEESRRRIGFIRDENLPATK